VKFLKNYHWIDLPLNITVLVIYLAIAKLGLAFTITESGGTIFWPAGGFALAILLLAGPKYIPGVFGGALATGLMIGGTPTFSILCAVGNTLETVCAYWLLTHFRPINLSLERFPDLFKLLFYGAGISTLISAIIGPLSLILLQHVDPSLLASLALRWWMGDAIGIAFVTPLILIWHQSHQELENKISLELIALFFLTILMGQIVLFHWFIPLSIVGPSIAWLLPFIIWSGLRAGRRHTSLLVLIIFLQALWGASHELGYYANDMQESGLVNFWMFGMLITVGSMILAIMATDRELAQQAITQNITKRKQAEEKLMLVASVFANAREGIVITDASGNIVEVNDTFSLITGYSREDVIGQNLGILQSGRQSPEFYAEMWKSLLEKDHWKGEVWNRRKSGEVYAELLTISAVQNATDQIQNYVALFTDITQLKEHQGQLEHIAHYDVLTNLPNRILLADRLSQAMVQCQRHQQSLAVAFLDLDGFKAVNDAHGHNVGDELLITLSQRMKEALREGDTLARIGGDEFIAVLADLAKTEDCQPVLGRLLQAASGPVTTGDAVIQVSASIGVTLFPQDGADADQLMRHADQAMYVAKQAGKNRYHLFDTTQEEAVNIQRESIGNIRSALKRREFVLHYQPKVNMHTGNVIGVEALIRWQHPNLGILSPAAFLPVIENHAVSLDVGEWVIDSALKQISQWQSMGVHLPISVNISAHQLQQGNFSARLATLLAAHPEVNPHYLELEVLETSALSDISQVSATMQTCSDLGVRFALDDFGTGYSSLTYLRRLPAHLIKIDQSFVRDMLTDSNDLAIVESVVGLAKAFQREVIAEGAETIEHVTALLQLGCKLAQGYGIAKPMPASDVPAWVKSWKPDMNWQR